jgi:hypothetical protein
MALSEPTNESSKKLPEDSIFEPIIKMRESLSSGLIEQPLDLRGELS